MSDYWIQQMEAWARELGKAKEQKRNAEARIEQCEREIARAREEDKKDLAKEREADKETAKPVQR